MLPGVSLARVSCSCWASLMNFISSFFLPRTAALNSSLFTLTLSYPLKTARSRPTVADLAVRAGRAHGREHRHAPLACRPDWPRHRPLRATRSGRAQPPLDGVEGRDRRSGACKGEADRPTPIVVDRAGA